MDLAGPHAKHHAPLVAQLERLVNGRDSPPRAAPRGLSTSAVPASSTGVYGYPKPAATRIAVQTVRSHLRDTGSSLHVTFCCFSAADLELYRAELG